MKKVLTILGVMLIIIGAYYFFKADTWEIKNAPARGKVIVAFGDSLVEGVGSTEGNDFVSLLSKSMGTPIINLGRSGDTTRDALLRVDEVTAYTPDVVIVLLGGNDFLKRVPKAETFKNLEKIVAVFQEKGAAVLVLGIRGGLLYDTYDGDFKHFAKTHHTAYVPNVLDGLLGDSSLMSDSIHPNNKGYALVAKKVLPVLLKIFIQKNV